MRNPVALRTVTWLGRALLACLAVATVFAMVGIYRGQIHNLNPIATITAGSANTK